MDLSISDVAQLLHTSNDQVKALAESGAIPGYKIHNEFRFDSSQIEQWLINKSKVAEESSGFLDSLSTGWQQYCLLRALSKGGVLPSINESSKNAILEKSVELIAPKLQLDGSILSEFLFSRENMMPTALGNGIAVPHARELIIKGQSDFVFFTQLQKPIEWGALDGIPVSTLFFIFAHNSKRHLNILAKIAHLAREKSHHALFATCPPQSVLLDSIKVWETNISAG